MKTELGHLDPFGSPNLKKLKKTIDLRLRHHIGSHKKAMEGGSRSMAIQSGRGACMGILKSAAYTKVCTPGFLFALTNLLPTDAQKTHVLQLLDVLSRSRPGNFDSNLKVEILQTSFFEMFKLVDFGGPLNNAEISIVFGYVQRSNMIVFCGFTNSLKVSPGILAKSQYDFEEIIQQLPHDSL